MEPKTILNQGIIHIPSTFTMSELALRPQQVTGICETQTIVRLGERKSGSIESYTSGFYSIKMRANCPRFYVELWFYRTPKLYAPTSAGSTSYIECHEVAAFSLSF
jgi:hypothetical protein